jgi:hypothetical protein
MTRQRALLSGLVALLAVYTALIAWARWELGEVPGDYAPFELAATRFWAGEPLYQPGDDPFLSPPPFVFFLLPAHALGVMGGHALALIAGLACSATALWTLRCAIKPSPSIDAVLAAALYLPIWLSASIGQWGGFFFLVFVIAMLLASQKRSLATGLVAALLFAKPTYAPFAIAIVALGLGRRAWLGLGLGALGWLLASLPLGVGSWAAWRGELAYIDRVHALAGHGWQHHTLFGSLRAMFAMVAIDESVARIVWLVIAVPMGLATIAIASRRLQDGDATRAFALAALATVALGVYVRYYDSQVVLIAALALFQRADRSRIAGALALCYLVLGSLDAAYFQDRIGAPVEGLLLTAWLAIALREAYAARDARADAQAGR